MFRRTLCVYASLLGAVVLFSQSSSLAQAIPGRECGGPRYATSFDSARHRVIDIPAKGWLLVEVGASDGSPTWFDVSGGDCAASTPLVAVERGLEDGLLEVEAGRLELRFGTVDPGLEVPLRLSTHFVPENALQPRDGEEGDDTETGDGEIVPNRGTLDTAWHGCLAGDEPFDDFGLCATWIEPGRLVRQQLGEFRGAGRHSIDRDHFVFELRHAARVRLVHHGTVPMKGTLMLEDGRPLVVAHDTTVGSLQLEAHLVAGTYLLRLEGLGDAVGSYELSLETSPF